MHHVLEWRLGVPETDPEFRQVTSVFCKRTLKPESIRFIYWSTDRAVLVGLILQKEAAELATYGDRHWTRPFKSTVQTKCAHRETLEFTLWNKSHSCPPYQKLEKHLVSCMCVRLIWGTRPISACWLVKLCFQQFCVFCKKKKRKKNNAFKKHCFTSCLSCGPDDTIVISLLWVLLCVLATCEDRNITSAKRLLHVYYWHLMDLWRRKGGRVYSGSIFRWDEQRDSGSSTSQTLPARHSFHGTCRCLCQVYWTACHCEMCRICRWDHRQSHDHQRHHQHLHQSSKNMSSGTNQLLVQVWKWHSRHT